VLRRFYVNNFRCLQNFEYTCQEPTVLLVGKNGSGKSTIVAALEVLQKIGRGQGKLSGLIDDGDFPAGSSTGPMRFEIEVQLEQVLYKYSFEVSNRFFGLGVNHWVTSERVVSDETIVLERDSKTAHLHSSPSFEVDATGLLFGPMFSASPLSLWLSRMLLLRPVPSLMRGESGDGTLHTDKTVSYFGGWFSEVLAQWPSSYSKIQDYLQQVMPDLKEIVARPISSKSRILEASFRDAELSVVIPFEGLSDGEKCFFAFATAIAANEAYGPLLCVWDEPDNYLAPSEVGHAVMSLRRAFKEKGQLIVISHNPEAIRQFPRESTFVTYRKSHLEPTIMRPVQDVLPSGDLELALIRGDLEP
jgi:predicted ATPase